MSSIIYPKAVDLIAVNLNCYRTFVMKINCFLKKCTQPHTPPPKKKSTTSKTENKSKIMILQARKKKQRAYVYSLGFRDLQLGQ